VYGVEASPLVYPQRPEDHPLVGTTAPELVLQTADGLVRLAELLRGQEFVLIDCTGDGHYRDLKFGEAPVRTVTGPAVLPPAGLENVRSLLVRPDSYIAWADEEIPEPTRARGAVERWLRIER